MAFIFGLLGRGFGGLASARGKGGASAPPPPGGGGGEPIGLLLVLTKAA